MRLQPSTIVFCHIQQGVRSRGCDGLYGRQVFYHPRDVPAGFEGRGHLQKPNWRNRATKENENTGTEPENCRYKSHTGLGTIK